MVVTPMNIQRLSKRPSSIEYQLDRIRDWADQIDPPPMQMRLSLYKGHFPEDGTLNFFGIVTGSQADFMQALPVSQAGRFTHRDHQGTINQFATGLDRLGFDLVIDAVEVQTLAGQRIRGLIGALRHLPGAILGKTPPPRGEESWRPRIVAEMAKLAERAKELGAQRIVLGALSKVRGFDRALAEQNILPVATGQDLTAVVQVEHVRETARRIFPFVHEPPTIGILGATGATGRRATELLAEHFPLVIVSRHERQLAVLAEAVRLGDHTAYSITPAVGPEGVRLAMATCQIILILTTELTLDQDLLPANPAVRPYLIDSARPEAIPDNLFDHETMDRGGYVWLPGDGLHLEDKRMRFPHRWMLPCLAEAIPLLASGHGGHFGLEPASLPWGDPQALRVHLNTIRSQMSFIAEAANASGMSVVGL